MEAFIGAATSVNETAHNNLSFGRYLLKEGGALVLAGCFALESCSKNIGPGLLQTIQGMLEAGEKVDAAVLSSCRLSAACIDASIATGVSLPGIPGRQATPLPGPNHTGGSDEKSKS